MIRLTWSFTAILLLAGMAAAQAGSAQAPTIPGVLDRQLSSVEREFVSAAEAMPEDKFSYAPTNGEFKGVRTFAQQVSHVAFTNYVIFAAVLGEKPPAETKGENGPETLKTKADIVKYLKDSFAYAHKGIATINAQNAVEPIKSPFGSGTATRLGLATLTVGHCFDHYGQMVVYLRTNGIIPPASRGQ
jgi:uncharacterized damage-inducible protein DinB